jgi:para-aminobenzoate synthetase/4-amino-4-deoxychorismate lyase
VAIRTLVLGPEQAGRRSATLGVGNGIVTDSDAAEEFAETQAKTRYLRDMDPGFTLFETLRVSHGRVCNLRLHMQRLRASAKALGFACDEAAVHAALSAQVLMLEAAQSYRLRLDLRHDGSMRLQTTELNPVPQGPALLLLAAAPVPAPEASLLNHKTSLRSTYDAAIRAAIRHQAFDTVFLNQQGEVTEGARSSLLVKLDGQWFTPALASGVLAGVMRQRLLQRFPRVSERVLRLDEVMAAQQLVVCSALRGLQHAQWLTGPDGTPLQA